MAGGLKLACRMRRGAKILAYPSSTFQTRGLQVMLELKNVEVKYLNTILVLKGVNIQLETGRILPVSWGPTVPGRRPR